MNVLFRRATPSDAPDIADVYLASRRTFSPFAPLVHSDSEVLQWVADVLIPSGRVTVATNEDELIGIMALSNDGELGWIDHLYLHPSRVRQGIGTLLIEHAKQELGSWIRLYTFQ